MELLDSSGMVSHASCNGIPGIWDMIIQMSPVGCVVFIKNFRDGDRRVFADKIHIVGFMLTDIFAQLCNFSVVQE